MKTKIISIVLIGVLMLASCESSKKTPIDVSTIKITGVVLNGDKLWLANEATTTGIQKMQEITHSFSENASVKEYAVLKENLETEFTEVFAKCTMKGESHNQLHNYLKPMLPLLDGFASIELAQRKKSLTAMNIHLAGYANYFK